MTEPTNSKLADKLENMAKRHDESADSGILMTNDELMALPDVTHQFGEQVRYLDGRRVVFPFEQPQIGALFQKDDDGTFPDAEGNFWMTGWHQGVRVRRLFR